MHSQADWTSMLGENRLGRYPPNPTPSKKLMQINEDPGPMPNANSSLTNADMATRSFGSNHDPVLDGISRGLEALFPPVYQDQERDQEPAQDGRDSD